MKFSLNKLKKSWSPHLPSSSVALRRELRKFGLRVIPGGKALPLLNHIYDQTHPQASNKMKKPADENKKDKSEDVDETISCSQGSQSRSGH